MNKYITYLLLLVSAITITGSVFGQSKTPTPSPTPNATEKSIENLKEKIATKVEELRKGNKNVVAGTISAINKDSIDITSSDQKTITVTIDDALTKIYDITSGKKKEIKKDAFEKENYVIVSGPTVENTVTANTIYVDTPVSVEVAHITNIDKDNFRIDIVTTEKQESTLDIETDTKQQIMDIKTLELKKVGFSKIKIGDTIHYSTKANSKDPKKKSVIRMLIIPQEYFSKPTP